MMLPSILHDIEMLIPLFSSAILVSEEEVYSSFLPQAFTKHTESIIMCCNRKYGCWKLKIIILLFILSQDSRPITRVT